jgi:hypothetical protein
MSQTITIRVPKELAAWIEETSARAGLSQGQIVRQHLERARSGDHTSRKFMRLAGTVPGGPTDLSKRKGYSKG